MRYFFDAIWPKLVSQLANLEIYVVGRKPPNWLRQLVLRDHRIHVPGFVDDIRTIEDALDIIDRSGHADATIVLDPFHCFSGGGTIESILKISGRMVAVSHFNDAPASPPPRQQRDPDRVLPGDGVIDLQRYCQLLGQIGYQGFLSLELFRPDLWERNPLDVAVEGLEKMRRVAES